MLIFSVSVRWRVPAWLACARACVRARVCLTCRNTPPLVSANRARCEFAQGGTKQNVQLAGAHASMLRRPFASHLHLRHSTVAPQQTHAVAPRPRCRCVDTQVSALGAARRLCRLLLRAHAPREHGQRQDDGRRQLRAPLRLHTRDVALLEPHGGRWNRTPLSPAPLRPRPWRLWLWSAS